MPLHPTAQLILDQAIVIIEDRGEAHLRIQDLTREAGVSVPSVYHFFGSREGVIEAAHAERFSRSLALAIEVFDGWVSSCETEAEFREAVQKILDFMFVPEHASYRIQRINALGNTLGRPNLAARIGELSRQHNASLVAMLLPAQQKGWIRPELDLSAFAYWVAGQLLGRIYIEVGQEAVSDGAWNAVSAEATLFLLFGAS